MEFHIKDLTIALEQESPFVRLTIGGRAYATAGLVDADDLEKIARVFAAEAKKLRGGELT
jgi:hypothetical protein